MYVNEFVVNNKKNTTEQTSFFNPFWVDSSSKKDPKGEIKKVCKIIWKILKLLLYAFLFLMGLWGCFQSMAEPETRINTTPGLGMEFGWLPGTEGIDDPRFILYGTNGTRNASVYSINHFSFAYGPFYAFFVWPAAALELLMMYSMRGMWGGMDALISIFVLLFIIRTITLLISVRSSIQGEKMQEIQGKLAEINAKYKGAKDRELIMKKQMETQALYKKYKIKPFATFEQIFITMPIFLIVYRVVTILRPLKYSSLFTIWNLVDIPLSKIFSGDFTQDGWYYIFFLLIIIPFQVISQKLPMYLSKKRSRNARAVSQKGNDQMKKTKTIQNVMMIFLIFIVVSSATGIGLYWFLSSIFSIIQTLIIHKIIMRKRTKGTTSKSSKIAEQLGIDL